MQIIRTTSLFLIILFTSTFAQDEPLLKELKQKFQTKSFNVGFLFQFVGDFQSERMSGYNGFTTTNLRFRFSGELDNNYGYLFWVNFVPSPKLLDAKMYYKFSENFILDLGQFKAPFSTEYLISEHNIDFVNRSQVASTLSLGRQTGLQARGNITSKFLKYAVGVFNGNGINNSNNNKHLMYVGRVLYSQLEANTGYSFSVNGAITKNSVAGNIEDQMNLGGDFRITMDRLFISSEYISSKKEIAGASITDNGFHATLGYKVKKNMQALFRYDAFNPGAVGINDSNYFILGYNVWPTSATEFQINYRINTDNSEFMFHQLLVNCQVAF